jgi:hypothetical protein
MKAKYLVAGGKNWQPFCQEKCAQNLQKFREFAAGALWAMAQASKLSSPSWRCRKPFVWVWAPDLSTGTSKLWMTPVLGFGAAWPLVAGNVETWPLPWHHLILLHSSVGRIWVAADQIVPVVVF